MKILSKKELTKILKNEKKDYLDTHGVYQKILVAIKREPSYLNWLYQKRMRITNYYYAKRKKNIVYAALFIRSRRKMNVMGRRIGMECGEHVFGKGLIIYHSCGNVINGNAEIGENCYLYGNNCVGNNGISPECPRIGNNVRLCVGAKVIGNIELADDVVVAAGAVVLKSCKQRGAILGGVPAKVIGVIKEDIEFLV